MNVTVVDTFIYLLRTKNMISKFKLWFKIFDRMMKSVARHLILDLWLNINHENFIIINCPELINIKCRATDFIILSNVFDGQLNLDITSFILNR